MIRRILAVLVTPALAAGMLATMAPGMAGTAQASCKPSVTVTHSSHEVQAAIHNSCGMRLAAYGNAWQTGYRVGNFKTHGYSVACVDNACNEGGGWSNGGWERLGGHVEHCTFGCGHNAPLNPLGYYHGISARTCPRGPIQNPYELSTLNGKKLRVWLTASGPGEVAKSNTTGRFMFWTSLGCAPGGYPMGYWKNYKKNVFSASSTCGNWQLKSSVTDNGTVTIDRTGTQDGHPFIMLGSRFCNRLWMKGKIYHVWASINIAQDRLRSMNLLRPRSGYYVKWGLHPNASAHTTALVKRGQCECVHTNVYTWGAKAEWTDNPLGFYERGWAYCRNNRTGATQTDVGPWRVNSFIYSDTGQCPGGFVLAKAGWQEKKSAGGSITTHQTWPSLRRS